MIPLNEAALAGIGRIGRVILEEAIGALEDARGRDVRLTSREVALLLRYLKAVAKVGG